MQMIPLMRVSFDGPSESHAPNKILDARVLILFFEYNPMIMKEMKTVTEVMVRFSLIST